MVDLCEVPRAIIDSTEVLTLTHMTLLERLAVKFSSELVNMMWGKDFREVLSLGWLVTSTPDKSKRRKCGCNTTAVENTCQKWCCALNCPSRGPAGSWTELSCSLYGFFLSVGCLARAANLEHLKIYGNTHCPARDQAHSKLSFSPDNYLTVIRSIAMSQNQKQLSMPEIQPRTRLMPKLKPKWPIWKRLVWYERAELIVVGWGFTMCILGAQDRR